ncbi:DUF2000 family protein [Streptomyces sp. NRRL S-1813]|nr:DUF2000 family protein [Streptomyces sp. NRRL S-1813]
MITSACQQLARTSIDSLDLVGLAVYGPRGIVDKITKGLKLHG